jgi:lysyl-tRNA synthetase class I
MNADMQEEMRETLIRRALEEVSFKEKQKDEDLCLQDTLAVLENITTLSREEMESLAEEVKRSYEIKEDTFFSIKHQILLAGALVGFTSCLPLLGMWLF